MATVEQLYKDFGVLADAKDKASEHEKEYLSILSAVQGGSSEKRLASQFIARFFKFFPSQAEQAIDAQLDLCEDADSSIRKQAIKDLPSLCKDSVEYVPRISDALAQLLQTNDGSEFSLVQSSLLNLFRMDAKGTLSGLFSQILNGDELVRERCIKFMSTKMKTAPEAVWTKEVEDYLVIESKKVLVDVTGDEFVTFMTILSGLKTTSTVQGRQQLVEVVTEQADLESNFEHTDPDCVDRLVQCVKQALPFFSKNVHSTKFVTYMCDNVLPVLSDLAAPEVTVVEGESTTSDIQLDVLKLLAEMSAYIGEVDNISELTGKVFQKLLDYMPLPPPSENGENVTPSEEPKLQFSNVECLMYTFHEMGRKCPEFLTGEEQADRLKDFRIRLQYFARGLQVYIKQLRLALQGKTGEALKTDENKIKVIALKITNNINILIKDLFHNPPAYKNTVNLSWKPLTKASTVQATSPTAGQKRPGITPITFESDGSKKASKQDRSLYAPPTGKFSEKAGNYAAGNRGGRGGRGRGGGGGRGGRGRGWRGRRW